MYLGVQEMPYQDDKHSVHRCQQGVRKGQDPRTSLRPQHIKKIVDTYRERKEIEKYSHLATLQEVAENHNLNIPRYVDTFEEQKLIDIHAVMKEIKELEARCRPRQRD